MKHDDKDQPPRRDETTGKGNPELTGESPHSTPGTAEGDRETVEESLRGHQLDTPEDEGREAE